MPAKVVGETSNPVDFKGDAYAALTYAERLTRYPNRPPWNKPSDKDN